MLASNNRTMPGARWATRRDVLRQSMTNTSRGDFSGKVRAAASTHAGVNPAAIFRGT